MKGAEADVSIVENGGTKDELLTTRNALVKAESDRDAAQRNLQAMQRLLQSGAASQAEVDAAQTQLRIAESNVQLLQQKLGGRYSKQEVGHVEAQEVEARASLAAAQQLLRNSNIAAPRDGMVYSLPVRQGAFVNAGDLLVQVADLHKVRVRAFVDEPEIGKLRKGQLVEVTWDAIPGRVWQGTLEALPTTVVQRGHSNGRRSDLRGRERRSQAVAEHQYQCRGGHRAAAECADRASRSGPSGRQWQFVFQVVNGELQRRDVKTSVANLTRIQVTSGLTDNAVLALGAINMQSLREGMPVKIANP